MGRGCLDSNGREKKRNFIISVGASEPAPSSRSGNRFSPQRG